MNYYIKEGDTTPPLTLYLEDRHGLIPSFSGKVVRFYGWSHGSPINDWFADRVGTVFDAATGAVQMEWQSVDTAEPGRYHVEVELRDGSGKIETFPAGDDSQPVIVKNRNPKP